MRISPVGLAYRSAPVPLLHEAVVAALQCTHTHPLGVDGAYIQVGPDAPPHILPPLFWHYLQPSDHTQQ